MFQYFGGKKSRFRLKQLTCKKCTFTFYSSLAGVRVDKRNIHFEKNCRTNIINKSCR